ncbi:Uncharacterised protein [Mycobacteroides abscessus subsp. abscessus]|nr:Uncharacterised protein [Mycobacteroides abscessus subsp. abscessus]SKT53196.1 Uncharacterised protein [Mycobacteroides abscessus subsp. abscessus]
MGRSGASGQGAPGPTCDLRPTPRNQRGRLNAELVDRSKRREDHVCELVLDVGRGRTALSSFDQRTECLAAFFGHLAYSDPVRTLHTESVQMGAHRGRQGT